MFDKVVILSFALFVGAACGELKCLQITTGQCIVLNSRQFCLNASDTCVDGLCCITDPAQNCDNSLGDSFCEANVAKCTDDLLKETMSKQCAKTCKTCLSLNTPQPGGTCVDKVGPNGESDCVKDAYLCNNPQYYDLMTQECPKTCGRCGSSPPPPSQTCVDKVGPNGVSDCVKDAYLCNNAQYYDLMTQQCPKTCGRC